jgi:hypothetical protein
MIILKFTKNSIIEYYTLALLIVGVPIAASLFYGWRAGLSLSLVIQAVLGVLYTVRSA